MIPKAKTFSKLLEIARNKMKSEKEPKDIFYTAFTKKD
jgi:hypothetical protein